MGHDVFISYSSRDKTTADGVCALLESESIRCWIAPRDILPGADWGESIIDAINGSKLFVLVFSESANQSVQIKREVERAVHKGLPIIPFRIEDVVPAKSLEYFLSTPHWLDAFTPPIERHIRYLAETIKSMLNHGENPVPLRPPTPPPQVKPKNWQIGAGAAVVAVLAAWYFLTPSSPRTTTAAVAPVANTNVATAEAPKGDNFVGKWVADKISPSDSALNQFLDASAFGEMMRAAFTGPGVKARFEVNKIGQYTYNFSGEDRGTVTGSGDQLTFTSAVNGKSATIKMFRLNERDASNMANIGAEPGDNGLVFSRPARAQILWFGTPQSGSSKLPAGVAGNWHNKAIIAPMQPGVWTGGLDITPDGKYRFTIDQTESGIFQGQDGQWTRNPDAGIPTRGNYAFDDANTFTAASNTGAITWKRAN